MGLGTKRPAWPACGTDAIPVYLVVAAHHHAPSSAATQSEEIPVNGVSDAVKVRVSGGEYSVNGGPYTRTAGWVSEGDTLRLRLAPAQEARAEAAMVAYVGSSMFRFSVTTAAEPRGNTETSRMNAGRALLDWLTRRLRGGRRGRETT